jgi:hypothetical protein
LSTALRQPEISVKVVEERRVPELGPSPLAVEDRERDEELGESVALLLEELGELVREFACVGHTRIVSCVF